MSALHANAAADTLSVSLSTVGRTLRVEVVGVVTTPSAARVARSVRDALTSRHENVLINAKRSVIALSAWQWGNVIGNGIAGLDDPIAQPIAFVLPACVLEAFKSAHTRFMREEFGLAHGMFHNEDDAMEWLHDSDKRFPLVDKILAAI